MAYRYECPTNDWFCPYFENGECQLRNAMHFLELKMIGLKFQRAPGRLTNK